MSKPFEVMTKDLTEQIQRSYEEGVTIDEAERLAAKFLHAQILISGELRTVDLDARMKKTGVKAVKAAVYLAEVQAVERKPSDVLLSAKVDVSEEVEVAQRELDTAEVYRDELQNYFNVFREAHIHFRGISKGKFE